MKHLSLCLMAILLCLAPPAEAVGKKKKKKAAEAAAAAAKAAKAKSKKKDKSKYKKFAELTKDAKHREGFFDTYQTKENLYLVIPKSRLGETFLINSHIVQGIGSFGLNGGTMLNWEGKIVSFEQHGNRVYLKEHQVKYTAPEGSALAKAVAHSVGDSVLASAKIESIKKDKPEGEDKPAAEGETAEATSAKDKDTKVAKSLVIDMKPWMMSDMSGVGEMVKFAVSERPGKPGMAKLDKSRSYLAAVKAFPNNLNIRAQLTFAPMRPANFDSVPDNRYLPFLVQYTFAALPEEPMQPREADTRIGLFMTVHKDYTKSENDRFFSRFVRRWRLEPGEKVGNLYKPKKPIVYYLDHSIPEEYRDALGRGVTNWNVAFEQAGFKDAIQVKMLPEGADLEDIRYPTLRWSTSDRPVYGAIGPSVVDPRTGEILDADILFEANMILTRGQLWHLFVSPRAAFEDQLNLPESPLGKDQAHLCHAGFTQELQAQMGLLGGLLTARGVLAPGESVPKEYVDEMLVWVSMHEVGHTLGLYHNFRSSTDTPLDKLHDKTWVAENGLYSSVMDYPSINIAPKGQENGYYFSPSVGTADRWTITYGYAPQDATAKAVARMGAKPGHAYGNDYDARGAGALDPNVNVYDLSADPLAWARQRANLLRDLWKELPANTLRDNMSYDQLTSQFQITFNQMVRTFAPAVKHLGGMYVHRDHVGDPGGRGPFTAIPKARQEEAFAFVREFGLSEESFEVPQELLRQLGANYWLHWGQQNLWTGRKDYPLAQRVQGFHRGMLNALLNGNRLSRIRDAELRFGQDQVLSIPEIMNGITESVWSEVGNNARTKSTSISRRDLQRAYLDLMIDLVTEQRSSAPDDARSVARMELGSLVARIKSSNRNNADTYTRAHLAEAVNRIEKALDANFTIRQ